MFAPVDAAFDKFAGKAIGKKEATQIVNKHLVRILSLLPIKLENNGSTAQCLTLCLKVEGTVYSLALIGHTYDTLSGATINTEAIENQETYIVKEGDHTANILVSFNLTSIQYIVSCIYYHDGILQELNQHATNGVIHAIDKLL